MKENMINTLFSKKHTCEKKIAEVKKCFSCWIRNIWIHKGEMCDKK